MLKRKADFNSQLDIVNVFLRALRVTSVSFVSKAFRIAMSFGHGGHGGNTKDTEKNICQLLQIANGVLGTTNKSSHSTSE